MRAERWLPVGLLALLAGCAERGPAPLLGTLEWDRVAVPAELWEPVLRWAVAEGDRVEAGDLLLELDARRHGRPDRRRARQSRASGSAPRGARARRADREDRRGAREPRWRPRRRDRGGSRVHACRGAAASNSSRDRSSTARSPHATAARGGRGCGGAAARAHARARGPSRSRRPSRGRRRGQARSRSSR